MLNAPVQGPAANHAGTIRGMYVSMTPRRFQPKNVGIRVAAYGSIIVEMTRKNTTFLPGQRSRENPYAEIEHETITPATVNIPIIKVFKKYLAKGRNETATE
jgi:hypothetical protein